MPGWKFVLDEQAFEFFRELRAADREALLRAFNELRANPSSDGSWVSRDDHGREVQVTAFGKFLIHYWDDYLVKELRIVRIILRG